MEFIPLNQSPPCCFEESEAHRSENPQVDRPLRRLVAPVQHTAQNASLPLGHSFQNDSDRFLIPICTYEPSTASLARTCARCERSDSTRAACLEPVVGSPHLLLSLARFRGWAGGKLYARLWVRARERTQRHHSVPLLINCNLGTANEQACHSCIY